MNHHSKLAALTATIALGVAPAFALAAGPVSHPGAPAGTPTGTTGATGATRSHPSGPPTNAGTAHKPSTPGPGASLPAKARAYGQYCQSESKQHVSGQSGTPFSACVTAMAKLASGSVTNPRTACQGESKQHVSGMRGTPFSACVSGAAKLLHSSSSGTGATGTTGTTGS